MREITSETPPATTAGSLTAATLWLMFGKTLAFAFSVALPLLLVRRMDQTEFGFYKQVFLVFGTAVGILPFGFGMTAFHFLPREHERRAAVVLNILVFFIATGGLACLLLSLRPMLLVTLFNAPEMVSYAPLIGWLIFIWIVASFIEIVVVANQEARLSTVFVVLSQFVRAGLMVAAAVVFGTVRALVIAAMVHAGLQAALLFAYLRSRFPHFWRKWDWGMLRAQWTYALPVGLAVLLSIVMTDVPSYFVTRQFGQAAYAVFAVGCFQLPLLVLLCDSVGAVTIPRVSYLQKEGDYRSIVVLATRVMRKLALVFFPFFGLMLVVGKEYLVVLFTDTYAASWPIFQVNLWVLPLSVIPLDPVVRAFPPLMHLVLRLHVAAAVALTAILWVGTGRLGPLGVLWVVLIIRVSELVIITFKTGRILGFTRGDVIMLKDVGKVALATLAAAMVAALVRAAVSPAHALSVLVVCSVAFGLVFVAAVLSLGVLTVDERGKIRQWLALVQEQRFSGRILNLLGALQR